METVQSCIFDHRIAIGTFCVGLTFYAFTRYMKGSMYNGTERIDGKTVIITGGNTGIGKETAVDLAKRGGKVIIACRDINRANVAATEIKQRSGSEEVYVKKLDLASLSSVRSFAEDINKTEKRLDILINNAGIMFCPYWKTEDGFEMQFGVNHLGHFLLTLLLLDLIKKSAPSRIITVSSIGHDLVSGGKMEFDNINREKHYDTYNAYGQSKLANILFTRELAKRLHGTGVTTYSLHPGAIDTELMRHWVEGRLAMVKKCFYSVVAKAFYKTPEGGAQTTICCAVSKSLENESGKYYSDCAEKSPSKASQDDGTAKKLWEMSETMVGLHGGK